MDVEMKVDICEKLVCFAPQKKVILHFLYFFQYSNQSRFSNASWTCKIRPQFLVCWVAGRVKSKA